MAEEEEKKTGEEEPKEPAEPEEGAEPQTTGIKKGEGQTPPPAEAPTVDDIEAVLKEVMDEEPEAEPASPPSPSDQEPGTVDPAEEPTTIHTDSEEAPAPEKTVKAPEPEPLPTIEGPQETGPEAPTEAVPPVTPETIEEDVTVQEQKSEEKPEPVPPPETIAEEVPAKAESPDEQAPEPKAIPPPPKDEAEEPAAPPEKITTPPKEAVKERPSPPPDRKKKEDTKTPVKEEKPKKEEGEKPPRKRQQKPGAGEPHSLLSPLIFGKFDLEEVSVEDPGLRKYINLSPVGIPHTGAKHANRWLGKTKINIVERLINNLMRTEHSTGKKSFAYKTVNNAFDIISKKTKENPIQVLVDALQNSSPKEEITRLRFGGISVPKAVDTSSSRRLDIALRNICRGTVSASHRNKKRMAQCLADEIILASKGDMNSFAISKKEETERIAASAR